jgi:branched-chain amino acid transport system ATP-binding protein
MRVSERIHALNEGRTLAEGTPTEIRRSVDVAAAYLGERGVDEE